MPKKCAELGESDLRGLGIGTHFVGGVGGLTLRIGSYSERTKRRNASWVLRLYVGVQRRNIGLGSYPEISLVKAREIARDLKLRAITGHDPLVDRRVAKRELARRAATSKTFADCTNEFLAFYTAELTNAKHIAQWGSTLKAHAFPVLGSRLMGEITTQDVLSVLRPIWFKTPETARRIQGRMEKILDYAISAGYGITQNPARWRNHLAIQLPNPKKLRPVENYPSLAYQDTPTFLRYLNQQSGTAARALHFLILTCVRSGTVREARWENFDFVSMEWRIPAEHTKTGRPHRVPITPQMLIILDNLPRLGELTFPSKTGTKLSDMALNSLMRTMHRRGILQKKAVPHGFRSTFKVWAMECTDYPSEISEMCLMHAVGNTVYKAYQRSDLFQKRRSLMIDWCRYLDRLV